MGHKTLQIVNQRLAGPGQAYNWLIIYPPEEGNEMPVANARSASATLCWSFVWWRNDTTYDIKSLAIYNFVGF